MDEAAVSYFQGLGRGVCPSCDCFREIRSRICHQLQYSSAGVPREPRVGDHVQLGPVRMEEALCLGGQARAVADESSPIMQDAGDTVHSMAMPAATDANQTQSSVGGRQRTRRRPGASTHGSFSFQRGVFMRETR